MYHHHAGVHWQFRNKIHIEVFHELSILSNNFSQSQMTYMTYGT